MIPCYKENNKSSIFVLPKIWLIKSHSGSGSRFMSRFSYPYTSVNSTLRDICYASMGSCFQGLSFIYLHLRPLNNLWGLYDTKTENMSGFLHIMEQFLHIELRAMPFIERSQWGLNFFFLHSWALSSFQDIMTKEHENFMLNFITFLSNIPQTLSIQDSEL